MNYLDEYDVTAYYCPLLSV